MGRENLKKKKEKETKRKTKKYASVNTSAGCANWLKRCTIVYGVFLSLSRERETVVYGTKKLFVFLVI